MAEPPLSGLGDGVRRHDPDRYLCALFAPAAQREALFTLLAFNDQLARAREVTSNPIAALIRLQWWREVLLEALAGKPPRRHEVAEPLARLLAERRLDPEALNAMVDAREAETEEEGIATEAAMQSYLRGTAGSLALATARLGGTVGAWAALIQQAGALYGLAGLLRSVPALAAQGRCLLPVEVLARHGTTLHEAMAVPDSAPVRAAVRELAEAGVNEAEALRLRLRSLPRHYRAAALPFVLARRDLARLARGWDMPWPRGLGDRLAVVRAGLLGL